MIVVLKRRPPQEPLIWPLCGAFYVVNCVRQFGHTPYDHYASRGEGHCSKSAPKSVCAFGSMPSEPQYGLTSLLVVVLKRRPPQEPLFGPFAVNFM